jgi:hypothetical protein
MRPVSEQADGLLRRYSKHEEMGVVLEYRPPPAVSHDICPGRSP